MFNRGFEKLLQKSEEFVEITKAIENKINPINISGVSEAIASHLAFSIAQKSNSSSLIVTADGVTANRIYEDMKFYNSDCMLFLDKELIFYDIETTGNDIVAKRLQTLEYMLNNEKILKGIGFKYSTYLPTALYALSSVYEGDDVAGYAEKAMGIYKEMKQSHPFLTSGDDYALAILLAGTDHSPDVLEDYYQALNGRGFAKSNGLQLDVNFENYHTWNQNILDSELLTEIVYIVKE